MIEIREMLRLWLQGCGLREVARLSGTDRKTVRRRPNGKSEAWEIIAGQHEQIKAWLDEGLTVTKVHILLGRRGVVVSYRTLHRYATTELGFGQRKTTVRVADCAPGAEVQVDFGRLGMLTDAAMVGAG